MDNFRKYLREKSVKEAWSGKPRANPHDRNRENDSAEFEIGKKYEPSERDVRKMINYYAKNSFPHELAKVTNPNKAIARLFISTAFGWKEAEKAFEKSAVALGASEEDIREIKKQAKDWEVPEEFALVKRKKELDAKKMGKTPDNDKDFAETQGMNMFYRAISKARIPFNFKKITEGEDKYYQITVIFNSTGKCVINTVYDAKSCAWEVDPDLTSEEVISEGKDWSFGHTRDDEKGKIADLLEQWKHLVNANN